ncbi:hypothetical protein ACJIZ3_015406 [Penstemon smallii]|uniref:Erythronate-4-phosphate dehydrogenase family protein n=1 Tax=Penstemon smallii TaxID=265156 RepID=A0ABD3RMN0_9LAMI
MDFNEEEEVLISLRNMNNSNEEELNENPVIANGHTIIRSQYSYYQPNNNLTLPIPWFDLRVFYVRVSKCVIHDNSTPDHLTLNHVPLNRDTLLESNGVRTSIYSDGASTLLKRDRLDRISEEVTFVSTDSIKMSGSVKFEVFHKDVMVLFGTLELCHSNGFVGESKSQRQVPPSWIMNCESDILKSDGFFQTGLESGSPSTIEVYVAGCFSGSPIILTKTLELSHRRKQVRKGMLESIPECEVNRNRIDHDSSTLTNTSRYDHPDYIAEEEFCCSPYSGIEYLESEDGELSWFNAGVRVGVGIGLSVCLGLGIGVGLLVRTYQGTTNFKRYICSMFVQIKNLKTLRKNIKILLNQEKFSLFLSKTSKCFCLESNRMKIRFNFKTFCLSRDFLNFSFIIFFDVTEISL